MTKKFTLATDPLTTAQEKAIIEALGAQRGWWHRLPGFWLIVDKTNTDNTSDLRALISKAIGEDKRFIVLEVDGTHWSGMLFNNEKLNEVDWIHKQWISD